MINKGKDSKNLYFNRFENFKGYDTIWYTQNSDGQLQMDSVFTYKDERGDWVVLEQEAFYKRQASSFGETLFLAVIDDRFYVRPGSSVDFMRVLRCDLNQYPSGSSCKACPAETPVLIGLDTGSAKCVECESVTETVRVSDALTKSSF